MRSFIEQLCFAVNVFSCRASLSPAAPFLFSISKRSSPLRTPERIKYPAADADHHKNETRRTPSHITSACFEGVWHLARDRGLRPRRSVSSRDVACSALPLRRRPRFQRQASARYLCRTPGPPRFPVWFPRGVAAPTGDIG